MLLVFALDEPDDIQNAYTQNKAYGIGYFYNKKFSNYPLAEKDEIVCITAHGNKKVIGNLNDKVSITAKQLAKIMHKQFLPDGYDSHIYIFTCDAAPQYISDFNKELKELRTFEGRVYGFKGSVSYPIPLPGRTNGWLLAN